MDFSTWEFVLVSDAADCVHYDSKLLPRLELNVFNSCEPIYGVVGSAKEIVNLCTVQPQC